MPDKEHVHALMTEIGPALELAEVQEFGEENLWVLVVREDLVLFVDYDPDDDRLWLSADVSVPPGDRLALYELMLQYNARWKETGGVRLALDGPEGNVVQAFDMPVAGLDLYRLRTVIQNFCDSLEGWRKIVAANGHGSEPAIAGGLDPAMERGSIQV